MSNYLYIFIMAMTTYLMRLLPLTLIRGRIKSPFTQSFLYYVPYVTLSILIFPSILQSTESFFSALAGMVVSIFAAYKGKDLVTVSVLACITVFIVELVLV